MKMPKFNNHFEDITLLITHFNRSSSLFRLIESLKNLNCSFHEIVISDDCSDEKHLDRLRLLDDNYKLVTSPTNKGLANNINKGQKTINSKYTLYIQEDFYPNPLFVEKLQVASGFLDNDPELDMVRFYAYWRYPYLTPYKDGFSKMDFRIWYPGYLKFYYYSDHPHLRRAGFTAKYGMYKEGIKSDKAEYKMMMSYLQHRGKALFYDDYQSLFKHDNTIDEPSTVKRMSWRYSKNPIITIIRNLYRTIKFNFDYFFIKNKWR